MRVLVIFLTIMISAKVYAKSISDEIVDCVIKASKRYKVPSELILAIIDVESGFHPYALNVAGRSRYFRDGAEAMDVLKKLSASDKSFDIGLMQINRWWFERFKYPYELGFDICFNINLGTYILAYEISRNGFNWEAIGRYHSKQEKKKQEYAFKVWKKAKKLK